MEEYKDNIEDNEELAVKAGEWVIKEATKLAKQYKSCKTAHAQNKLRPKLEYMLQRLAFEKREIERMMGGYD